MVDQQFTLHFSGHKTLNSYFKNDPKGLLEWLENHGPLNVPDSARISAPVRDWIEAGAGLDPSGTVTGFESDSPGIGYHSRVKSLKEYFLVALGELFLRTGTLPDTLDRETTLGVLSKRKEDLDNLQKEFRETEKRIRLEKEERRLDREAYENERLRWCAEHGSPRLRKAVDMGLLDESNMVYQEERLEKDYPGWEWERDSDRYNPIHNPSLKAMEALEKIRCEIEAESYLHWMISCTIPHAVVCTQILTRNARFSVR